jgi:hypothetical protein
MSDREAQAVIEQLIQKWRDGAIQCRRHAQLNQPDAHLQEGAAVLDECANELSALLADVLGSPRPEKDEKEQEMTSIREGESVVASVDSRTAATNESQSQLAPEDALGLTIDMLDVDRLRQWANNLLIYGSDISAWGDRVFVAGKMQEIATGVEKAVRDIGVLRSSRASADLLAALKLAESVYRQNCIAVGEPSSVLDAIQAAIAKAEGRLMASAEVVSPLQYAGSSTLPMLICSDATGHLWLIADDNPKNLWGCKLGHTEPSDPNPPKAAEVVSPDALIAENRRLRSILAIEEARHRVKNHTNGGLNPIGFYDDRCEVCNRFKAALNDGKAAEARGGCVFQTLNGTTFCALHGVEFTRMPNGWRCYIGGTTFPFGTPFGTEAAEVVSQPTQEEAEMRMPPCPVTQKACERACRSHCERVASAEGSIPSPTDKEK